MGKGVVRVSVVIVTYNSTGLLKECLDSIFFYNDIGEQLEVLVVDNNSQDIDKLKRLIVSEANSVRLIENTINGGYGQGNNLGIREALGDIIMIMNPDVRLRESIFNKAIKRLDSAANCVLLGMKQWDTNLNRGESYRMDDPYSFFLKDIVTVKISNMLDCFDPSRMYISGACFFVKKQEFELVGLFDEKIFMYYEECDIKRRIINTFGKGSIRYDKKLSYIHAHPCVKFDSKSDKRLLDSLMYFSQKYNLNLDKVKRKAKENRMFFRCLSKLKGDRFSVSEYEKSISYLEELQ